MHQCTKDIVGSGAVETTLETSHKKRTALAAEVLRASGRLRLRVRGESMLPALWPHDVVEIVSCSLDDMRTGEIALALRQGRFYLHRFVGRCPSGGFWLRGDSMPKADSRFPAEALLGRLAGRDGEQFAGDRSPFPLHPWPWMLGRLMCYFGPARRLALKLHASFERRRNRPGSADNVPRGRALDLGVS